MRFYSDPNSHIAFQEAYQEDFEYSDFFRDQASHRLGDVRREFICVDLIRDLKSSSSFNPSQLRPVQELQTELRTELRKVRKFRTLLKPHSITRKHTFRLFSYKSDGQQRQYPGRDCRYLQHG